MHKQLKLILSLKTFTYKPEIIIIDNGKGMDMTIS